MKAEKVARDLAEATLEILIGVLLLISPWVITKLLGCLAVGTGIGAVVYTFLDLKKY